MRTPETALARRESIYYFIKKRGEATADTVAKEFKVARRTACRHIQWLLDEGYIEVLRSEPTRLSKHPVNRYCIVKE